MHCQNQHPMSGQFHKPKNLYLLSPNIPMILRFFQPHLLLQSFVSNIMIYTHHLNRIQSRPVNFFLAIPEHSLYFYPRDP
jgi:hypothetical protein